MKKTFALLLICTKICFGQSLQLPKNIQSPTTGSLGKYGDVPVSFYTGVPNINIPIYTMEELGVKLDISLSYDASGVQVSSLPSWVGQNWSLNAGGVITRAINGLPDELNKQSSSTTATKGYFYPESHQRLNVTNWADLSYLKNIYVTNILSNDFIKESQPDVFTFNFMGCSGKFFLGEDGQWKVASECNLKVKILESDFIYPLGQQFINSTGEPQPKVIGKIEITDDKGITYTFGGNITSIEYSKNFFSQRDDRWDANSWYLTKVTNNYGKVLFNLYYTRDSSYTASFYNYQNWSTFNAVFDNSGFLSGTSPGCSFSPSGSGTTGVGDSAIGGSLISPVYLNKIASLTKDIINFNSNYSNSVYYESANIHDVSNYCQNLFGNNGLPLDTNFYWHLKPYVSTIEMINKLKFRKLVAITGNVSVTFGYNEPHYGGEHEYRFNLNSIDFSNSKVYSFEYDRFEQLPTYLSKAFDHLGYFKGTEYLSPTGSPTSHFNQRLTDANKILIGSLTKRIYPTKGFTQFEYEPHNYSQYVSDDKQQLVPVANSIIGGIRIKKITSNDNNGNLTTKEYKYVKDFNLNRNTTISSGILSNLPKYYWTDWRINADNLTGYLSQTHFSINPLIPLGNYFGSPIGYSEVVELNSDQSYTVNKYTSNQDFKDEVFVSSYNVGYSPYEKYNDRSLLRGKLKETLNYNSSNSLVEKTINTYSTNDFQNIKYVRGTNIGGLTCSGSEGNGFLLGNAYKIYYFDYDLIKQENYSYLNGQELKQTTDYNFEYYPTLSTSFGDRLLKSSKKQIYLDVSQVNAESIQETYSYAYEIPSTINNTLLDQRVLLPLQNQVLKNTEILSTKKVEYNYIPTIGSSTTVLVPSRFLSSKGLNPLEEKTVIDYYDIWGQVFVYHNNSGIYTNIVRAGFGANIIAKIEGLNIDYNNSYLASVSVQNALGLNSSDWDTNYGQIVSYLQALRDSNVNNMITTYTYKAYNNIYTLTNLNGYTTYFEFDGLNRLKYIKDSDSNIMSKTDYHYKN